MDDNDALVLTVTQVAELADLTVVDNVAGVSTKGIGAGQDVHQGGLTGAVFAADSHDFALFHLQINIIQCFDPGELFGNVVHFQDIF